MSKCDTCLNSRIIISENGLHSSCTLSDKKAVDCILNKRDGYIKSPQFKNKIMKCGEKE